MKSRGGTLKNIEASSRKKEERAAEDAKEEDIKQTEQE